MYKIAALNRESWAETENKENRNNGNSTSEKIKESNSLCARTLFENNITQQHNTTRVRCTIHRVFTLVNMFKH